MFELAYYDATIQYISDYATETPLTKYWSVDTLNHKEVPVTVVSKEGYIDSILGHERTIDFLKKCHCKQCFLLQTSEEIFYLIY